MQYGKFNSAEELLKGYNELEKTFTQKCQQLSDAQRQLAKDAHVAPQTPVDGNADTVPNGQSATNLGKKDLPQANAHTETDANATQVTTAHNQAEREQQAIVQYLQNNKEFVLQALKDIASHSPEVAATTQTVGATQPNTPQTAFAESAPTVSAPTVMAGGGNLSVALPSKPKTIREASILARQLFKN